VLPSGSGEPSGIGRKPPVILHSQRREQRLAVCRMNGSGVTGEFNGGAKKTRNLAPRSR
jgi:hypothetical protein